MHVANRAERSFWEMHSRGAGTATPYPTNRKGARHLTPALPTNLTRPERRRLASAITFAGHNALELACRLSGGEPPPLRSHNVRFGGSMHESHSAKSLPIRNMGKGNEDAERERVGSVWINCSLLGAMT